MQSQTQGLRTQIKADPRMILANSILHMSSLELQVSIEQEILENPLLERSEEEYCERCGEPGPRCRCNVSLKDVRALEDGSPSYEPTPEIYQGEWLDPLSLVEERATLADHLLWQARACTDSTLHQIIEYLICSLKPSGYLGAETGEVANVLCVPEACVEKALRVIQALDPAGVGARDLRECLLLQVTALEADGGVPPLVRPMLTHCWKSLSANKTAAMVRQLKTTRAKVDEAVAWIRDALSPYPGERFRTPWEHDQHRAGAAVRPDVVMHLSEEDDGFTVSVIDHERTQLHLNPAYARLWRKMRKSPASFPEAERKSLSEYWIRAHMFLRSLGQRKELLLRVTECLMEEQEEFFRTQNPQTLQPLTQTKLAGVLRVHESTISRTVADKFIQLPDGDVLPFSYFFGRSTSLKGEVAALIAEEDPTSPLSDQKISDLLHARGFQVARRTVMKYREELNILSTRQRARS